MHLPLAPQNGQKALAISSQGLESLVGAAGFELATLCSQSRCATRLRYAPTNRILSGFAGHFFEFSKIIQKQCPGLLSGVRGPGRGRPGGGR